MSHILEEHGKPLPRRVRRHHFHLVCSSAVIPGEPLFVASSDESSRGERNGISELGTLLERRRQTRTRFPEIAPIGKNEQSANLVAEAAHLQFSIDDNQGPGKTLATSSDANSTL